MSRYAVGLDFGTLSGRALLCDVSNGREVATAVYDYPHAVMDEKLPCGKILPQDWALQHPRDYTEALEHIIPAVIKESGVAPEDVICIGVDFTASTAMPVDENCVPLCLKPEFAANPHAYVKLWKHHSAQKYANLMTDIALQRGEKWLENYGGKVSGEWALPKIYEVYKEAPEIYQAMDAWMEAGDWLVYQMTGVKTHSLSIAGYKDFYNKKTGYPPREFFAAIDAGFADVTEKKLSTDLTTVGTRAGGLTAEMAKKLGLLPGTTVAVSHVDAHVCVPSVGITRPGQMLAIMGTSTCHMILGTREQAVPGMCGVVQDGIIPGFYGYEAGQSCVGDGFSWFVKHFVPASYTEESEKRGMSVHQYLTELSQGLRPGESGLLMLDWWNGNRSVLVDYDLQGLMLGMTLQTKPEEMYRAMIEATAFGTKVIVDNFEKYGIDVREFFVSGGISQKNPMAMQIYADVLNMPVRIAGAAQGPALGSAIFGTVAAGKEKGGYATVEEAAGHMGQVKEKFYSPIPEHTAIYDKLYQEYVKLHDYFGRGGNDVMKRLKTLKNS